MGDLDEDAVVRRLRGRFGVPYRFVASCPTTQGLLRDNALPEGAVVSADHQTAGRGRSGRRWEDVPGEALLCSILLRPPPGLHIAQLSLAAGLAVAQAVEGTTGLRAALKWPNDVLLDGHKVAGVLVEAHTDAVICGIGVNVAQAGEALPSHRTPPAGSLRTLTGRRHDRAGLLVELLARLEECYGAWIEGGLATLLPELEARNWLRGRRVAAANGLGVAGAIAPDGRLAVTLDRGATLLVASGEVRLAPLGTTAVSD
jgi:BirA family biotin operon repressor/biotin-[acetyl-CoA-carboxylase] ligase